MLIPGLKGLNQVLTDARVLQLPHFQKRGTTILYTLGLIST